MLTAGRLNFFFVSRFTRVRVPLVLFINEIAPSLRQISEKAPWINSAFWDVIFIKLALCYGFTQRLDHQWCIICLTAEPSLQRVQRWKKPSYDRWPGEMNEKWGGKRARSVGYISIGKPTCTMHLPEKHWRVSTWEHWVHKDEAGRSQKRDVCNAESQRCWLENQTYLTALHRWRQKARNWGGSEGIELKKMEDEVVV